MRIAFVSTDPGIGVFGTKGAAVHAQAVLRVLCADGHDVHLVTVRPGGTPAPEIAGVTVHPLTPVAADGAAARERTAQRSDAEVLDVLDRIQPDLVYERYALWGRSATAWARDHAVPSVLEVNAPLVDEQARHRELVDRQGAESVARSAFAAATAIVCVSDGVSAWVRSLSTRPESVHVLPNGVDVERILPRRGPLTRAQDPFTVGFVGTLKPWHGLDVLLDALGLLGSSADWRLLVVGDGPLRDHLRARADAELAGLVEFTGALPNSEVAAQLRRMDLGCAPYPEQEDFYFSPLKLYEYLAAGLPIVASEIGQIGDILDGGRLGRLVPPGDAAALAGALADLRHDLTSRERLSRATRIAAERRHTWTTVVRSALDLALRADRGLETRGVAS